MKSIKALATVACVVLFNACGGGAGGDSAKVTCASFRYQEDAQANYQKSLDRDNDGIACEDLPHRPISTSPTTPTTGGSPTVVERITFVDTLSRSPIIDRLSDGFINFYVYAYTTPVSVLNTGTGQFGNLVTVNTTGFKYFKLANGYYTSSFSEGQSITNGIGYSNAGTVLFGNLVGEYRLMGRVCAADTGDQCSLTYGTAMIQSNGSFRYCPGTAYTATCASSIAFTMSTSSGQDGNFSFVISTGRYGGLKAGLTPDMGVTISMLIGTSYYSLFGQQVTSTAQMPAPTTSLIDSISGYSIPSTVLAGMVNDYPLPGFSGTSDGAIYLRNNTGLTVIGRPATVSTSGSVFFAK